MLLTLYAEPSAAATRGPHDRHLGTVARPRGDREVQVRNFSGYTCRREKGAVHSDEAAG